MDHPAWLLPLAGPLLGQLLVVRRLWARVVLSQQDLLGWQQPVSAVQAGLMVIRQGH
jgi:hypothetical protein